MAEGKFQGSSLCIVCIALDIPRIVFLYSEFSSPVRNQQYKKFCLCVAETTCFIERVIIATSFSWKFNTDKVFSLFSLLCKQIDLSVPWDDLKVPKYMHGRCLMRMLNVGPLGQTCPRDSFLSPVPVVLPEDTLIYPVSDGYPAT